MIISLSFVACLQQARAIFFKEKGDFEDARAWREKTGGCLLFPSHVPISLSITANQKFKTCACHTSHVLGSRNTHLLLAWVKARPKTSLKSWLVRMGGWGDDQARYLPLVFRSLFYTLLFYTDLPRAFLQTALCNSWLKLYALESWFVKIKKRYWDILYLTTHVSYFK